MNDFSINSERLILIPPKIKILQRRLKEDDFKENISINGKDSLIHFPKEWAEVSKVIFPMEIERKENDSEILPFWIYLVIDKKTRTVIGDIGCKEKPGQDKETEIGYGINPSEQKKGYATEAVKSLSNYLFSKTDIVSIKAECNIDNISSIRVLEKTGFERIGSKIDDEDGELIIWKKKKENL
ncbi:MAG TPA: GNAT family N-acetyltransferase [Victivallales bacterium]|nr:GNAT family N-acetyltransferase [Victivallales bacterium]